MQRSRLSISQSRRRSVLRLIFEVKYFQYIAFRSSLIQYQQSLKESVDSRWNEKVDPRSRMSIS